MKHSLVELIENRLLAKNIEEVNHPNSKNNTEQLIKIMNMIMIQ